MPQAESLPKHEVPEVHLAVCSLEGGGVHEVSVQRAGLAAQALHQHSDGHAGGECVRVDDQIWPAP